MVPPTHHPPSLNLIRIMVRTLVGHFGLGLGNPFIAEMTVQTAFRLRPPFSWKGYRFSWKWYRNTLFLFERKNPGSLVEGLFPISTPYAPRLPMTPPGLERKTQLAWNQWLNPGFEPPLTHFLCFCSFSMHYIWVFLSQNLSKNRIFPLFSLDFLFFEIRRFIGVWFDGKI